MARSVEIPTGTINGTNRIFTTAFTIDTNPVIFINGILYPEEDTIFGFTFTNNTFTITTAPQTDDVLLVSYTL
jgi:hypothetical protein